MQTRMEEHEARKRSHELAREEEVTLADLNEAGHMTGNPANGYDQLHADVIKPLEEIDRMMHQITLAICQAYGAYG